MDHHSHIVVGCEARVVAGGRITASRPEKPLTVPMEEARFRLAKALPQFRLNREPYAEFSRAAVDPNYGHERRTSSGLIPEMAWTAANSRKSGVQFHVFPEIEVPTPFRIPMTLCTDTGLIEAHNRFFPLSA